MRPDSSVFKNEEILSPEYLPEILPHRETQVQQVAKNLEPASYGRKTINTFIFGGPGIGKTATAKFVFRKFEEEYSNVKTVYLNCWDFNTSIAVLSELAIQLGWPVQRRGWGKDEVMNRFVEAVSKSKRNLVVCLDEVDQLIFKDQSALYDLLRINQYTNKNIGLVFISNNPHVFADLEPRVMSSLSVEEIEFKPYTLAEMKDILQERTKYAFASVEPGVIALASNHAVQKGGDVRVGLQLLQKAGREAEKSNSDKLKVSHVKKFLLQVEEVKPKILKEKVSDVEKIIVDIVNKKNSLSFGELYKEYEKKIEKPLTQRRFWNYVNHLAELRMIKLSEEKVGRKRMVSKMC